MKKKKIRSVLVILFAVVMVVAGCGNNGNDNATITLTRQYYAWHGGVLKQDMMQR
ncbi:MAG: hypothetical protein ACRC3H_24925 [Lachnospiraceae bacterium]